MMSFAANLTRARSHLIIVFGLITASALIMTIEANEPGRVSSRAKPSGAPVAVTAAVTAAVTPAERRAAAWAWAHLPPSARTPELAAAAARLGAQGDTVAEPGPAEAAAILRALDRKPAPNPAGAAGAAR